MSFVSEIKWKLHNLNIKRTTNNKQHGKMLVLISKGEATVNILLKFLFNFQNTVIKVYIDEVTTFATQKTI